MLSFSLLALAILFFVNLLASFKKDFGIKYYWFIETEHFLSGFFLAMLLSQFMNTKEILLSLGIVTLIWELIEFVLQRPKLTRLIKRAGIKKGIYSIKDTLFDVLLNYVGAIVFFIFFK